MTPAAAVHRVLEAIDGIEIDGDRNEAVSTLLRAGIAVCGIALLQLPDPCEREARMEGIEPAVRNYIEQVLARRSPYPKAAKHHDVH